MGLLNPNLAALEATAEALGTLLEEIAFVGGTLPGLLIDDPGASCARVTRDVDVIAQIAGTRGYLWASKAMRGIGFRPDTREGAPTCRWVKGDLVVDLMGTGNSPFGEANPWYAEGFRSRVQVPLPGTGLNIHIIPAPVFLLTKWVAYLGRGQGSMAASQDIEDILNVLDGRLGLPQEAKTSSPEVRSALARMAHDMFASEQFRDYGLESLGDRKEVVQSVLEGFASL